MIIYYVDWNVKPQTKRIIDNISAQEYLRAYYMPVIVIVILCYHKM